MIQPVTRKDLIVRPYGERQHVVVVPDEVLEAPAQPELPAGEAWADRLTRARHRLPDWVPGSTHVALHPALKAVEELRDDNLPVVAVATSEAAKLDMPIGHPRPTVLYVGDPVEANRYYPAADFHHRVFEHKFGEAMRLVMGLGATHVRVRWEKGWRGELVGRLQAPLSRLVGQGKLSANAEKKSSILFEANLDAKQPELPPGLVWFPYEELWQAIAEGRIAGELRDFDLTVKSTENYGIDSSFEAKLRRKKLVSIGGEFGAHKQTVWRLQGQFGPRRRRWFGND